MEEIWKDIKGYEGLYQVSNLGRVRSLGNGNSPNSKCRIMKYSTKRGGYLQVQLWKDKKGKFFTIHRLVAQAFIPNPENLPDCNHINECKTDNRVENLEWCTEGYNTNYGTRNDRVSKALRNGKTSKQIAQYKDDKLVRIWPSSAEVQRQLGYSSGNIRNCCRGGYKQAYGFKWEYTDNKKEIV